MVYFMESIYRYVYPDRDKSWHQNLPSSFQILKCENLYLKRETITQKRDETWGKPLGMEKPGKTTRPSFWQHFPEPLLWTYEEPKWRVTCYTILHVAKKEESNFKLYPPPPHLESLGFATELLNILASNVDATHFVWIVRNLLSLKRTFCQIVIDLFLCSHFVWC